MDGSADAPPTEVAATVLSLSSSFFEGAYYKGTYSVQEHPQFPKYTYLENRGCNYV